MRRLLPLLVVGACLVGPSTPARASWIFDADAGFVYETNVGLAQKARDVKSDGAFGAGLATGLALPLSDRDIFAVTGDLNGSRYVELPGLSNAQVGATTAFRHKLGLGAAAPWLKVWGSGARLEYDDAVRDGWRYRLGTGVGTRLGGRWDVRVDYVFEDRRGDHGKAVARTLPGDVFDTTSHTYSARVDFHYNDAVSVFSGYALRDGDVVSTTRRNGQIFAGSTALTADRAFGPDFFAYKIDATVHVLSFGLSFVLSPQSSLNFGYERQLGFGPLGLDYFNDVVRAGVLWSF